MQPLRGKGRPCTARDRELAGALGWGIEWGMTPELRLREARICATFRRA